MPTLHRSRIFRPALQIAGAQFAVGLLASLGWLLASASGAQALAALAGGAIPAMLTLYVAVRLPEGDDVPAKAFLGAFYRAQAMKLGIAVGMLALAALVFVDQFLALITTLGLALAVHWLALLWVR